MVNYFSPTDIYWIFPQEFPLSLHKDQHREKYNLKFTQKSIIRGSGEIEGIKFLFQDYSGIFGIDSLKNKLKTLGLSTKKKSLGDKFKKKMDEFLINHPNEFLQYAEEDVLLLPKIKLHAQKLLNNLCSKLKTKFFEIPLTIGSMTSKFLIKSQKITQSDLKIFSANSQKGFFRKYKDNPTINIFSFILGGRCRNNNPKACYLLDADDIDIKGCYTNIMKKFSIPVKEIEVFENLEQLTIEEFLLKNKFFDDYWIISFDAEFPFDQNFFPTRLNDDNPEFDADNLPNDHMKGLVYFTRQVKNGFITHNILQTLNKYWTKEQINWLLNNRFNSAIFYLNVTRTIPLKPFIETMNEVRYSKKDKKISCIAKLIINTIYGVLCSPFFIVGNILVANLITATARCQMFELEKNFNCHQSITDGGLAPHSTEIKSLDFEISYKARNVKAFFFNKADYAYQLQGKTIVKIRGTSTENVKYNFAKSMLEEGKFELKTRLYFEEGYYKFGAYNHELKSKGYLFSKDAIVGSVRKVPRLFTLSANHLPFENIDSYKRYLSTKNKILRKEQNLFEQKIITEKTIQSINIHFDREKIRHSRIKSKHLKIIKKIKMQNDEILTHLLFTIHPDISQFQQPCNIIIGYSNIIIKKLICKEFPQSKVVFIPDSYYHKQYYNSIELHINKPLKTQKIEFQSITPLQGEKTILNKIYSIIYNQKDYFIRDIIFIVSNYIITDEIIEFFLETIKTMKIEIPYRIYYYDGRSNILYS